MKSTFTVETRILDDLNVLSFIFPNGYSVDVPVVSDSELPLVVFIEEYVLQPNVKSELFKLLGELSQFLNSEIILMTNSGRLECAS